MAGVIVGATSEDKTFSLTGSAGAISNLLQGSVNAGWSYQNNTVTGELFTAIFPASPVRPNADGTGIDPASVGNPATWYTIAFRAVSLHGTDVAQWQR
jgi:hypothetical protein